MQTTLVAALHSFTKCSRFSKELSSATVLKAGMGSLKSRRYVRHMHIQSMRKCGLGDDRAAQHDRLHKHASELIHCYLSGAQQRRNPQVRWSNGSDYGEVVEMPPHREAQHVQESLSIDNLETRVSVHDLPFHNVCTADECEKLAAIVTRNCETNLFSTLFSSPGERKLALTGDLKDIESVLLPVLGVSEDSNIDNSGSPAVVIWRLKQRMKVHLGTLLQQQQKNEWSFESNLREEGCILSWLTPLQNSQASESLGHRFWSSILSAVRSQGTRKPEIDPKALTKYSYSLPHCDKANNFEYDYTVLLYLNSEFVGGNLVLHYAPESFSLEPKAGRLVTFASDARNIHAVDPVLEGNRLLLSVWFKQTAA